MAFLDIQFPPRIAFNALGGPEYQTDVVVLASGHEQRNQNWAVARGQWDVAHAIKTAADKNALIAFFRVAKGRANSFRFKDWLDFEASLTEGVLTSLGGGTYQLAKRYTNAAGSEDRNITLPVNGTVVVKQGAVTLVSGGDYSINYATGVLTVIGSPMPAPTAWSGEFDVPARFDTDRMQASIIDKAVYRWESIPIVEVRV